MELSELVAAALILSVGSHLALRGAPGPWHHSARERRERTLRRIAAVARDAQTPRPVLMATRQPRAPADYSRYAVPLGLRLDQARRIVQEARATSRDDVPA